MEKYLGAYPSDNFIFIFPRESKGNSRAWRIGAVENGYRNTEKLVYRQKVSGSSKSTQNVETQTVNDGGVQDIVLEMSADGGGD